MSDKEVLQEVAKYYSYKAYRCKALIDGRTRPLEERQYAVEIAKRMNSGEFGIQRATKCFLAKYPHRTFGGVRKRLQLEQRKLRNVSPKTPEN